MSIDVRKGTYRKVSLTIPQLERIIKKGLEEQRDIDGVDFIVFSDEYEIKPNCKNDKLISVEVRIFYEQTKVN